MSKITFTIDGKEYTAEQGETLTSAARRNKVYIPTLCDFKGLSPVGTCRVCTCKVNGEFMAACTTEVEEGMEVVNNSEEILDLRKAIIEMLMVEGNHQCAICEKSGNCDLQALGYKFRIMIPRFPYLFPVRTVETPGQHILLDTNRCIQCLRCVRGVITKDGKHIFKMKRVHKELEISIIPEHASELTEDLAKLAVEICPVGAILGGGEGYKTPIGKRKYDEKEIGEDFDE